MPTSPWYFCCWYRRYGFQVELIIWKKTRFKTLEVFLASLYTFQYLKNPRFQMYMSIYCPLSRATKKSHFFVICWGQQSKYISKTIMTYDQTLPDVSFFKHYVNSLSQED